MNLASGGIYVAGKVRLYFKDKLTISGTASITLAPGASLEIYLADTADIGGQGLVVVR